MNTKQLLVLTTALLTLATQVVAMEETDAQKARRLRMEAMQKQSVYVSPGLPALLTTPQSSSGQAPDKPVAPKPVAKPNVSQGNDNNAPYPVEEPTRVSTPIKPITKPVVRDEEPSAQDLLKDHARALEFRNTTLKQTRAGIEGYIQSVLSKDENALATEFESSLRTVAKTKATIAQQRTMFEKNLEFLETKYANDPEFRPIMSVLTTSIMMLNLQEQLLDNVRNTAQWDVTEEQLDELVFANLENDSFAQALNKIKTGYILARVTVFAARPATQFAPAPADNDALLMQFLDEEAEEVARDLEMQDEATKSQEEQAKIEREIADTQFARLFQAEATGTDFIADENEFVAQQLAREEREAQEAASFAAALALQEEARPSVDNDILLAQQLADEVQVNTNDDEFMAFQMNEQLREQERAEQEQAGLEAARRLEAELNRNN